MRFNFCWRALNRWPILERAPMPPSELLWADQLWYKWTEAEFQLWLTLPHLILSLFPSAAHNTLSSCVFSDANHRRPSCTPSQEETSKSKHAALTPSPCVISYIKYWITAVVGTARGRLLPVSTWCYIGVEDSFSSICCLAQPLSQMDSGPGAFN